MLPLPVFHHHAPSTLDEVVTLLAELGPSARLIAGGTDLLPNMKHGLVEPEHLVSAVRQVVDGGSTIDPAVVAAMVAHGSHREDSPLHRLTVTFRTLSRHDRDRDPFRFGFSLPGSGEDAV